MNRRKLTFELRANTPEIKALHKYLDALKSNDSRRYNEFIKNALLTYHAHLMYSEKFLTDEFGPEEIESSPYDVLSNAQRHGDVSQFTKKVTSSSNGQQKTDDSSHASDEAGSSQMEHEEFTVVMDDELAKIIQLDDDIP